MRVDTIPKLLARKPDDERAVLDLKKGGMHLDDRTLNCPASAVEFLLIFDADQAGVSTRQ